jgi:hypothetical protein
MYLFNPEKIPWANDSDIKNIALNKKKFLDNPNVALEF